ncbi:MAG: metallophosphoesterase [Candidatus Aminicenantes bacterium]|jgi:DNA repair exonuclease SbcCD nuclease subunit
MGLIRILFLADTHLGFDFPLRPRIKRRRRGPDFFSNFQKALEPARRRQVDAVVHGGDLFFRSKVSAGIADMAFQPLKEVASLGVKVFIVPGNHERSRLPFGLLSLHKNIHVFLKPATYLLSRNDKTLALSGFPYCRKNVRSQFLRLLEDSGWRQAKKVSHSRLLCIHHLVEGAKVGPVNYTFRSGDDVIRTSDIPADFLAVLSGHVHRSQVLKTGLKGLPLRSPILYPGAIERTSFAEKDETKGYFILEIEWTNKPGNVLLRWHFQELPTRPMAKISLDVSRLSPQDLRIRLRRVFSCLDPDSVVKLEVRGDLDERLFPVLQAASLRTLCPEEMTTRLSFPAQLHARPDQGSGGKKNCAFPPHFPHFPL